MKELLGRALGRLMLDGQHRAKRGYGPLHTKPAAYRKINKLNRSSKWKPAQSYADARALSPSLDCPMQQEQKT